MVCLRSRAFLCNSNLFPCIAAAAADGIICIIQWLHVAADSIVELAFLATSAKTTGAAPGEASAFNALHLGRWTSTESLAPTMMFPRERPIAPIPDIL